MPTVYDDEKLADNQEGKHNDLGVNPVQRRAESKEPQAKFATSSNYDKDENPGWYDGDSLENQEKNAGENSGLFARKGDQSESAAVGRSGGWAIQEASNGLKGNFGRMLSGSNKKIIASAGGGITIVLVILLLYFIGTMKVAHFSEIISASGYARLNSILKERTTQNMFDAAVSDGKPSAGPGKSKLWDRLKSVNPQNDLVRLGQEGRFKFEFSNARESAFSLRKTNTFQGVTIDGKTIRLDDIAQEKFGKSSYYTLIDPRKTATVRAEFTNRVQTAVGEKFFLESRHVRSAANKAIMNNVGFGFSRWQQKARQYIGKDTKTAAVDHAIEGEQQVQKDIKDVKTGIANVDETVAEMRKSETLRKFMIQKGGKLDFDQYVKESFVKNQNIAFKTADVAGKVGQGAMLLSLACLTNVSFNSIDETNRRNELQSKRVALQLMAASSQTRAGDTTAEALAAVNSSYDGGEQAPRYQKATGKDNVVVPEGFSSPKIRSSFGPAFIETIDLATSPTTYGPGTFLLPKGIKDNLDAKFCGALLSPEGLIIAVIGEIGAQAVICFFTACTGTAATEAGANVAIRGLSLALKKGFETTARGLASKKSVGTIAAFTAYSEGLEAIVGNLSGLSFSATATGANRVEQDFVGTEAVQNHQMRSTMRGRPLTPQEKAALERVDQQSVRAAYNSKGTFARYLSTKNPFSLSGKVIAQTPGSATTAAAKMQSSVKNMSAYLSPAKLLSSVIPYNKAYAAPDEEPDGVDSQLGWGYSLDEREKMRTVPSFRAELNSAIVEPRLAELDAKYKVCYEPTDQYDSDELVRTNENCSVTALSTDDALRWRIYTGLDTYITNDLEKGLDDIEAPGATAGETAFTIATYNILSSETHTAASRKTGGCDKEPVPGDATCGKTRTAFQVEIIGGSEGNPAFDIIGTQENSREQHALLQEMLPEEYDVFPENADRMSSSQDGATAIYYNTNKFKKFDQGKADGISNTANKITFPWVGLETTSGQKIYVTSIHYANAACSDGNCSNGSPESVDTSNMLESAKKTIDWVKTKAGPTTPVFVVGDFNDTLRQKLSYCTYTEGGLMQHAADMSNKNADPDEGCEKNRFGGIDHIFATPITGMTASGWKNMANEGLAAKASDHTPSYVTYNLSGGGLDAADTSDVPTADCYTVTRQKGTSTEGRMFHISGSQTYAFENSPAGIKFAAQKGFDSIDLDIRLTKDGVPVATHWERPMAQDGFFDPQNKISENTNVKDMTFEEVSRLKNRDGQSQILSLTAMIELLAENSINGSLEFKDGRLAKKLPEISAALNANKVKAYVKAEAGKDALREALATARNHGFWTRGTQGSQDWKEPGPGCV